MAAEGAGEAADLPAESAGAPELPAESVGELTPERSRAGARRRGAGSGVQTPVKTSRARAPAGARGERDAAVAEADAAEAVKGEGVLVAQRPRPLTQGEGAPDPAAATAQNAVTVRLMKTKMCFFFEKGKCQSMNCRYAHSASELRHQPNLHKTKMCRAFLLDGKCPDAASCSFAHSESELRVTDGIYKTQMCHFFERGRCLKGDRCNHAHGPDDLRKSPGAPLAPAGSSSAGPAAAAREPGEGAISAKIDRALAAARGELAGSREGRGPGSPLPLAELLADSPGRSAPSRPVGARLSLDDAIGPVSPWRDEESRAGGVFDPCALDPGMGMMGYPLVPPFGGGFYSPWLAAAPGALEAAAMESPESLQALAALSASMDFSQALSPALGHPMDEGYLLDGGLDPTHHGLSQCLASLDSAVAGFEEDVRALAAAGGAPAKAGAAARAAEPPALAEGPRRLHRI